MLEFEECEQSGQLVAHSNHIPFCSYWIDECAWTYLESVTGDGAGPNVKKLGAFNSVIDAIKEANSIDAMGEGNE